MRYIFSLILLLFAQLGFAQVEQPVTNSVEPAVEEVEIKEVELKSNSDTTHIDRYKVAPSSAVKKTRAPRGKKVKAAERSMDYGSAADEAPAQEAEMSTQYELESSKFKSYKSESSVQRTQRSPSVQLQTQMNDAVEFFATNAPNSFEYHYYTYAAGNYNIDLVAHLDSAESIRPNNTDVQVQKAAYNIITDNAPKALEYIDKLEESGRLTENVVAYGKDVLISSPENGTLITHGFDDSYGTYTAQKKDEVREDVTLVSLDFLQSEAYRDNLKSRGYEIPNREIIDVDYFVEFCRLNQDKSISISMTTPKEYLIPLQEKLYVVGLTFEYHSDTYNNFSRNDELWNNQLEKTIIDDVSSEKSRQLSSNYLPMLLQLRKVYVQKGEVEKAEEVDKASDKVAVQCKKYEQVQKLKSSYGN